MKIEKQNIVELSDKDSYILATMDGKYALNGKFIDLLVMSIGILCTLYEQGTPCNKKFLENSVPKIIKQLAEHKFNADNIDL